MVYFSLLGIAYLVLLAVFIRYFFQAIPRQNEEYHSTGMIGNGDQVPFGNPESA